MSPLSLIYVGALDILDKCHSTKNYAFSMEKKSLDTFFHVAHQENLVISQAILVSELISS